MEVLQVTAENATLPDETPVLQIQPQCASFGYRGPVLMESDVPWC